MTRPLPKTVRWLLFSDLHFKHHDLNRVRQTAQWIVAEAKRNRVDRVVVCGDLLTSRTMQSAHVLSACYRFISSLSDVVPRVHIVLGNHDLAYRRDYQTTALDALNIKRLTPYVSLHSGVAQEEWDGRRVLLLPFREEQSELTEAVAALGPSDASKTVAFAHLAIHKAITQRYVVSASVGNPGGASTSITHRGLTGPGWFASLARTFTGHFHSHQTITQAQAGTNKVDLRGSVTYLGSPLQLSWADLYDEQRGVVLFDPETLEHELVVNPHAVGYITADLQQVLDGQVDEGAVTNKHVMLIGQLTHLKYVTARDKLLSIGARSVRDWTPVKFASRTSQSSFGGLGASVPASDAAAQPSEELTENGVGQDSNTDGALASDPSDDELPPERLDLSVEAQRFVESLDLDESLSLRRNELVRVGQRMIQVSHESADMDDEAGVNHQDFLDGSSQPIGTRTVTGLEGPSTHVFVAEPRKLTITNFLGVQGTITIDFRRDLPRGLIFLVGHNGSGKSTVFEAMAWCQFGRCIRDGLAVNDVTNDKVGKNCSVILEFANGYTIARYRKHKIYKNRVIVSLRGEPQPHLEHPDAATTQKAICELLGTDYGTYVRTVVLGHESAASFLNSKPAQRRELIEASLGLSILDKCGKMSRMLVKDVDAEMNRVEGKLAASTQIMDYHKKRLEQLDQKYKQVEHEAEKAAVSLESATKDHARKEAQSQKLDMKLRVELLALQNQINTEQESLQELESSSAGVQEYLRRLQSFYAEVQEQKHAELASWSGLLQQRLGQRLEAMATAHPTGLRKLFQAIETYLVCFLLAAVRGLSRTFATASDQPPNQEAAVDDLRRYITISTLRLHSHKHDKKHCTEHIALMSEQISQKQQKQTSMNKQLTDANKTLQHLQQQATMLQHEAATYKHLAETEQSSLHSWRLKHDALAIQLQELAANRELFVFWSSALAKRTGRASSPSSPASKTTAAANFREHILSQSISELNTLLIPVLTVLYDGTRHADMATGMLHALFDSESADDTDNAFRTGSVLGPTLAVNPSLAYHKLSSGERKRVDLALFFALLQIARARSAHRAHYVLIDEVFDNLDKAGQAAVVRWCGVISQSAVGWVIVITHSPSLFDRDPGQDSVKALVVQARMGEGGTELVVDGRKIGADGNNS